MARQEQFPPSPEQSAIYHEVSHGSNHLIIDAKAGCGKTHTLVEACELMDGKVFLGAYNNKIAKEIREKVAHLPHVYAKTFHAAGNGALRFAFKNMAMKTDANKIRDMIDQRLNDMNQLQAAYFEPLAPTMCDIVSMAKQRGIGALPQFPDHIDIWEDMIDQFDLLDKLPEGADEDREMMGKLIAAASRTLKRSNENLDVIDFDDMVYLPLVKNLRLLQHDWVLIDEAQDTNPTRRALATKMLKRDGRLIAVGDPNQAIYGFSGADNDSLQQIERQFNAKVLPLSITYRCPKSVVAVAQQWVPDIHAAEVAPNGEVSTVEYDRIIETALPGDAILCRYNKYLVSTCFKFIRAGIPAQIEGRAIGQQLVQLCKKWKVVNIDKLAERIGKWKIREMAKAQAAKKETKMQEIEDRADTIFVLIDRALEQGMKTVAELTTMIMSLFDDNVVNRGDMVTLCSVHRSKGMEWQRVFVLGLYELMGRECNQPWQTQQEVNLQYVAVTRAQSQLFLVNGVKEETKKHNYEGA